MLYPKKDMTLTLERPDSKEAALRAKAQEQGVSAEQYVQQILDRDLEQSTPSTVSSDPFWQTFTRQMRSLPDEVFDRLPPDGAAEHDHYLYGSPKKNSRAASSLTRFTG
jgi:methionyl-tRNA synthetase